MPEKLTLTSYLVKRGKGNALTKIEAEAFGIDYPLVAGWPARHREMEITAGMLEQLKARIAASSGGVARRARRGLDAVEGMAASAPPQPRGRVKGKRVAQRAAAMAPAPDPIPLSVSPVPGFALRQARRYRARKSAPWS